MDAAASPAVSPSETAAPGTGSVRRVRASTRTPVQLLGWTLFVGVACALLLSRVNLVVVGRTARPALLALIFASILVASVFVPYPAVDPNGASRVPRTLALLVGLVGVGAAAVSAGRPVPLPVGAATLPLSMLAAIAEEALFRRAVFGALERSGAAVAVVVTATLFALVHVPLYGVVAFPVDLGAGLVFGWQRSASATWAVPAVTHAAANLLVILR
jgi:membrane protease YdiL (CAAX protease family)